MKILQTAFTLLFVLALNSACAQDTVEMADVFRSSGKIYVVIAVMLTILLGLVLYIVRLDRKISKMEKNK